MPALVLDCDGVLADTERHGHLAAFNQAFAEFGLPVRWSVADYRDKLRIGGGKERMASLLTPEFVARAGLPSDQAGQREAIADWHRRKTEIYTRLVTQGRVPPRPGIARIVGEAIAAGWPVVVASTSAQPSVVATLERAVGAELAAGVKVFAGDVVPRKKPAPDIYLLALDWLGLPAGQVVVIEDSRNGLPAASGAGLACVITVNDFTRDEDFGEAALVVSTLGDPGGEKAVVIENRAAIAEPRDWITLTDLANIAPSTSPRQGAPMSKATFGDVERVVRTIATVAVENEKYFGDLDAVVGDGDFGYSMARGFEIVLADWDALDRTDIGTFLKKVAVVITSRIGGTSGPIWGTAFLRAGASAGTATELEPAAGRGDAPGVDRGDQGPRPLRRR
jgi:HAD superfamily hydrolase (TIGR01509 family)